MQTLLTLGISLLLITACDSRGRAGGSTSEPAGSSAPAPPIQVTAPSIQVAPAPSTANGGTNAAALRAACESSCSASAAIKCAPEAKCIEGCLQNMRMPSCNTQLLAFMACASHQAADKWECDDGVPSLKDGICDTEQARVASCLGVR